MTSYILLTCSIILNIIFLIISISIYRIGSLDECDTFSIYNYILFSNIKDTAKSGDLLLFSNSRYNFITRVYGDPTFSHMGIIVKKNNKLYTLELIKMDHVYPKKPKIEGTICIPLEDRLSNYSGQIYYCKLNKELSEDKKNMLLNKCIEKQQYSIQKACNYFIAKILEDLNIATNLTTWKIWNIHNNIIKLCNGDIYQYPINLISDIRLLTNIKDNKLLNYC